MVNLSPIRQHGFTIVEIMIVVLVIGILSALALPAYRDNSNRARMSEVVLATAPCRLAVSDGWLRELTSPGAGKWGCEQSIPTSRYVGGVQTSTNGEIRVKVRDLHDDYNGLFVYLKPYESGTPPASGGGVFSAGQAVRSWKCGVATTDAPSQALLAILPSTCRDSIVMSGSWAP